jgi:hypothetical protein
MDKKPLIWVSILVVFLLIIASMDCLVSANPILNHSVTIEITGQNLQQHYTINVSETELQKIKKVFIDVSVGLESASSPEDKLQVYWNSICRLHDLGVLGNLSCEETYRIATCWYRPSTEISKLHHWRDSNTTNAFCLISGRVNYSISSNRVSNLVNRFCWDYLAYLQPFGHTLLLFLLSGAVLFISTITVGFLGALLQHIVERNPIAIGNLIGIGAYLNHSKAGWVKTYGFLGKKNWDGNLTGALPGYIHLWPVYYYQAMWGFCGIKIEFDNSWVGYDASYLGSALVVGINEMT